MSEDLDKDVTLPGMKKILDKYGDFVSYGDPRRLDENLKTAILSMKELCSKYLLTISMTDYARIRNKQLTDYSTQSVDMITHGYLRAEKNILETKMKMAIKARRLGAEAVVDVRSCIAMYGTDATIQYIGTALIPNNKVANTQIEYIEELFEKIETCLKPQQKLKA